jgi:aminopeptidase N
MPSLTRDEARGRAASITVLSYHVDLDLSGDDRTFASRATIRFRCADPSAGTFVDLRPHRLAEIVLNGTALPASVFCPETNRLTLDGTALAGDNKLTVEAAMAYSHDGEGLHRYLDPVDGRAYLYAMSFLDAAPRWFPCFDQPDLKAPVTLTVTCPPDWTVLGNAPAQPLGPGRWTLATSAPIATYMTTLVAGPYASVADVYDGIPLGVHVRASLSAHLQQEAPEILAVTRACLEEFHRLFGIRYPWGEYHQAFVPQFNAGAMENPGCVTLRDSMVFRSRVTRAERTNRAITIAHEMAHMWFGDLVTMRWWDDLWLNESFAEYLGQRVCDVVTDFDAGIDFGIGRKAWGYAADRRPSTHPVAGNGAADAATALSEFDGISYAKGAALLTQLAAHLGPDVFLSGLREYFAAHAYANAELADLITAWTAAGAVDLDRWADQWLRTSGLDTLSVVDDQLVSNGTRVHSVEVGAFARDGTQTGRVAVTVGREPVRLTGLPPAPLVLPDVADVSWAKIALSPAAVGELPDVLARIADPTARVVIWNALRLAVADAEVDPRAAIEIVRAALPAEASEAVISTVLGWATGSLAARYVTDQARPTVLATVAATAGAIADTSAPGSGRQLAAVRGQIAADSDAARLLAWLADRTVPRGLVIDDELRWTLLERCSALGALSSAEIDAEAARDRTAQGEVHAATCRALRPQPEAKQAAWHTLMTDAGRSNYELCAIAQGFWHPEQTAITAPYVPRYFAEIAGTAELHSGMLVSELASRAYPTTAVAPSTVEAANRLLQRPDLPVAIRRPVVDATDDLRRALGARQRYG